MEQQLSVAVRNTLPSEIVAVAPEVMAEAIHLAQIAKDIEVKDAESLEAGNATFTEVRNLLKKIEDRRREITRPIDALKAAIIEAERKATMPLTDAKESLGLKIVTCQRELQRVREEAERIAREEAEKKAAEERARLEAERQAKIKADQEEFERKKKAAEDEAALFGTEAERIAPPTEHPPVVVVPEVIPPGVDIPAVPKAAARVTKRAKVEVINLKQIPFEVGGVCLWELNEKVALQLLKAGVQIPGLRLAESESIVAAGGRK